MVAVYCQKEDMAAKALRDELLCVGIPCALAGPAHGSPSILYKTPMVLFSSSAVSCGEGLLRKLPYERILTNVDIGNTEQAVLAIETAYLRRFGEDYANARGDGIRFEAGRVYFRGHYLPLTATEYRIMRLLFHSRGVYFLAEEVAAACLSDQGGSVAGHICNINQKARRIAMHAVIESRRFSGYRMR